MGLFRRKKDEGNGLGSPVDLSAQISPQPVPGAPAAPAAAAMPGVPPEAQEAMAKLQQAFPGATMNVSTRVIDASHNPELRSQVIGAIETATGQDIDGDGKIAGGAAAPAAAAGGVQSFSVVTPAGFTNVPMPGGTQSAEDQTISKLERLAALHTSGALTDAEFQAEKAKLLSEG